MPDAAPRQLDRLAQVRTAELEAALRILGIDEHHWLDYPDGGCADVDTQEAADRIVAVVDDVRPDTVITFGPDGFTGHPDHQTVSRWTDLALTRAATRPRLLHAVAREEVVDRELDEDFGVFELGRPRVCADDELAVLLELDGQVAGPQGRGAAAAGVADGWAGRGGRPGTVPGLGRHRELRRPPRQMTGPPRLGHSAVVDRNGLALCVDVLGPLVLRVHGGDVPVPGSRRRALLALLALEGDRGVGTDRLVDSLWPDDPPENAVQALYSLVSPPPPPPRSAGGPAGAAGERVPPAPRALRARRRRRPAAGCLGPAVGPGAVAGSGAGGVPVAARAGDRLGRAGRAAAEARRRRARGTAGTRGARRGRGRGRRRGSGAAA